MASISQHERRYGPCWKRFVARASLFFCPFPLFSFKWYASIFGLFVLAFACVSFYLRFKSDPKIDNASPIALPIDSSTPLPSNHS